MPAKALAANFQLEAFSWIKLDMTALASLSKLVAVTIGGERGYGDRRR